MGHSAIEQFTAACRWVVDADLLAFDSFAWNAAEVTTPRILPSLTHLTLALPSVRRACCAAAACTGPSRSKVMAAEFSAFLNLPDWIRGARSYGPKLHAHRTTAVHMFRMRRMNMTKHVGVSGPHAEVASNVVGVPEADGTRSCSAIVRVRGDSPRTETFAEGICPRTPEPAGRSHPPN